MLEYLVLSKRDCLGRIGRYGLVGVMCTGGGAVVASKAYTIPSELSRPLASGPKVSSQLLL